MYLCLNFFFLLNMNYCFGREFSCRMSFCGAVPDSFGLRSFIVGANCGDFTNNENGKYKHPFWKQWFGFSFCSVGFWNILF